VSGGGATEKAPDIQHEILGNHQWMLVVVPSNSLKNRPYRRQEGTILHGDRCLRLSKIDEGQVQ
jgi:hypothetical protein